MHQRGAIGTGSSSDLALFLQSLAADGRAVVAARGSDADDADALPLLEQLDARARGELALPLPAFSADAALWGARLCHQLCRFVVCRDLGEDQINAACAVRCPDPRGPQTNWSVDLTLHHLPRLYQLASHLSTADPLLQQMKRIAVAWPLSSVGIPGLDDLRLDSFLSDPALRRLYADRVLATGDTSRLGDARLDDLLRGDLGLHHALAPAIAAKLFHGMHETN